jgi:hypothetical protein
LKPGYYLLISIIKLTKTRPLLKRFIACLLLFQIIASTFGQKFKIEVGWGMGSYSMTDLKELNRSILASLPVDAAITDNFPSQPFYNVAMSYLVNQKVSFGITGSYCTTGSRISYKDYSGELKYDNILSSYSPGIQISYTLSDKTLRLSGETNFSASISKLRLYEEILTYSNSTKYYSTSFQIEPGLKLSYLIKRIEIGVKAAYLIDLGGRNKGGEKESILRNTLTEKDIKTNWSGIRLSISLGILI